MFHHSKDTDTIISFIIFPHIIFFPVVLGMLFMTFFLTQDPIKNHPSHVIVIPLSSPFVFLIQDSLLLFLWQGRGGVLLTDRSEAQASILQNVI